MLRKLGWFLPVVALTIPAFAGAEETAVVSDAMFTVNNLWILLAAALVFIMHLGFAALECGLTQSKNTVNILFKNTFIVCIAILTYAFVGFNLMYPGDFNAIGGVLGFAGFGLGAGLDPASVSQAYADGAYTYWADFIFQGMFAATCCTIVSGAVAERVKLGPFLVFCTIFVALIYTIAGSWKWGGGWLDGLGFYDFAGSTLVHSVGGWAALVGAWMLGPRLGKYKNGQTHPIPGSNLPLAAIGVFLLWLGWFGFNGGSVLSADAAGVSYVFVTTSLAAAAGGVAASLTSWVKFGKPDLSMALNGILAGLVGITAGADVISINAAMLVGLIAGVLVFFSVLFFDKIRIDDPVGALSVHLVCGIFGTLAVGIWGTNADGDMPFMPQVYGVLAYAAFTLICSFALFSGIKAVMGLRVSAEEETDGLDFGEHGMHAYDLPKVSMSGAGEDR